MPGPVGAYDMKRHAVLEGKREKYGLECIFTALGRQVRNSPLDSPGKFDYSEEDAKGSNWDHESRAMSTAWSVRFWHCRQPV